MLKVHNNKLTVKCFNEDQLRNLMVYVNNSGMRIKGMKIQKDKTSQENDSRFPCLIYYDVDLSIKPKSNI